MTALRSRQVLGPAGFIAADVLLRDGSIVGIEPHGSIDGAEDLGDLVIAPGFVDLQINGAFGHDFTTDPSSMWEVAARLPEHGVTAFCPTIITAPEGVIGAALDALADRPTDFMGAEPLGLHLEGPLLSRHRRGAHPEEHLRSSVGTEPWHPPSVRIVTVAPEVAGSDRIADLAGRGIVVSIGHTDTDAAGAAAAFAAGASHVTHLFSAMRPMLHREPGPVGVALADPRVSVSLIVDGIHVAPETIAVTHAAVGSDRFVPITDAVAALGMPPGTHELGAQEVTSDGSMVTLADGTLAGSALSMPESVANLVAFAGVGLADSLRSHSTVPADVVGTDDRGRVEVGRRADLVVLDGTNVVRTLIAGRIAYEG